MNAKISFDLKEVLKQPLMAHLSTMCVQGPRNSPVWFLWEDDEIWLVGTERDSYVQRLKDDNRCAIGIVDFDLESGTLKHVSIRGEGFIEPIDKDRLIRFLNTYIGKPDTWRKDFKENVIDELSLMIRVHPNTIQTHDTSYFK